MLFTTVCLRVIAPILSSSFFASRIDASPTKGGIFGIGGVSSRKEKCEFDSEGFEMNVGIESLLNAGGSVFASDSFREGFGGDSFRSVAASLKL